MRQVAYGFYALDYRIDDSPCPNACQLVFWGRFAALREQARSYGGAGREIGCRQGVLFRRILAHGLALAVADIS